MPRRFLVLLPLLWLLSGCAFVTPRFEQNVQTEFVREDMRKLSTRTLELYYPARLRPSALRIAARLEDCVERLRLLPKSPKGRPRVLVYLTGEDFNNAYVVPDYSSIPQQMVLPSHMSLELFNLLGFGPAELGAVGCHEAVHYVQMQQTDGLWGVVNTVSGGLFQTNALTESWFLEGLATFYEGRLGTTQGRPHSPVWRGFFEAASQSLGGELHPGYLNPSHRRMDPFGGNYLTGSHFVEWLWHRHGEDKLWQLVADQGGSLVPPLGVTLRFRSVYGRTIGALFDEFSAELQRELAVRTRPATQRVLAPQVGSFARMGASRADGAVATVDVGRDEVPNLTLRERDGTVRWRRALTQFLPGRRWISTHPINMSGLSFTADGQSLFLLAADVDVLGGYLSRVWHVDARTGDVVRTWQGLRGMGGGVTPDGRAYVFVHVTEDTANLYRLDLATGEQMPLTRFEGQVSLGPPDVAADGRIVFSRRTPEGWNLALREPDGTVRALTGDGHFNYAPRWLDDHRLVFVREREGRWQAHVLDLAAPGEPECVTNAPHLVMDVAPRGDAEVVFLNREGFDFSLDAAPLLAQAPAPEPTPGIPAPTTGASRPEDGHRLDILSDTPYPTLEHFFWPELRAPYVYALPDAANPSRIIGVAGVALAGQDRLGLHQYALLVEGDTALRDPSVSLSYATALAAPWSVQVSGSRIRRAGLRDLQASLSASRSFWTTPVSARLLALRRDWLSSSTRPGLRTSLIGPEASVSFASSEGTAYGGTQRGLSLNLSAGVYPVAFDGARPFAEVRAELMAVVPGLPGVKRDNLLLSVVGHALPHAPEGLFQVGGIPLGAFAFQRRQGPEDSRSLAPRLQPGVSFVEPLRGYEDFALSARHVLIASARYRYRVIFDYGWTSFLWLGPSFFISQLEAEVFGSWARVDLRSHHRAAGGALFLRTNFGQSIPLSLFYQYARRFDDGLGHLHLVGIAL